MVNEALLRLSIMSTISIVPLADFLRAGLAAPGSRITMRYQTYVSGSNCCSQAVGLAERKASGLTMGFL